MNKKIFTIILALGLAVSMSFPSLANTGANNISAEKVNPITDEPRISSGILEDAAVASYYPGPFGDGFRAVEIHEYYEDAIVSYELATEKVSAPYNLYMPEELEAFLAAYREAGSLAALGQPSGEYFALTFHPDLGMGTAILFSDGAVMQIFMDGDGSTYLLPSDAEFFSRLAETGLSLETLTACYFVMTYYAGGILFSDGVREFYMPYDNRSSNLEIGSIYSAAEVIADIEKNAEHIASYVPLEVTYEENGKFSVATGGPNDSVADDTPEESMVAPDTHVAQDNNAEAEADLSIFSGLGILIASQMLNA